MSAWKVGWYCWIRSTFEKESRNLQSPVVELRRRMEKWRLSAYARLIHDGASVYIGATVEQKAGRVRVTVLRGDVQQRPPLNRQPAHGSATDIEFREPLP